MTTSHPLIVAIDGPAAAGKSTVSQMLARRLGFSLVDTGALYRCVALKVRRAHAEYISECALKPLLQHLDVRFSMEADALHVFLDGEDVSQAIRTVENGLVASQVSTEPLVRRVLLAVQRQLALSSKSGAILEGRDIGTVVFPQADVKVYLFAEAAVRAERRHTQLHSQGLEKAVAEILNAQDERDRQDIEREMAPLRAAEDAVHIDATTLSMEEVAQRIQTLITDAQRTTSIGI